MRRWLERIGNWSAAAMGTGALAATAIAIRTAMTGDEFNFASARVEIVGGARTDEEALGKSIREAAAGAMTTNKLALANIGDIAARIKKTGWVKNVAVRREYPRRLAAYVEPKNIIATWSNGREHIPVDENGEAVREETDKAFPPMLYGEDAPEKAPALLRTLASYPPLLSNLAAAERVSGTRWNITLYDADDGLVIMLSAEDAQRSVDEIAALDRKGDILKRKISAIDARIPDKIMVKPK
ncbi:MAG: cell division protein FtsQ/DivIB [Rickettsiales bacterium]|nr:cell division protein FtsQ/DivIB [Rickettsiales bacterium]